VSTVVTESFSDTFLADPADYENGRKPALVKEFGNAERTASDLFTGEWRGSTFDITFGPSRKYHEYLAGSTDRYFGTEAWTVKMTDRDTRSAKGLPYVAFVGPPIDMQPLGRSLGFKVTLGDVISRGLLSDEGQIPWRKIGDGFLDQLTNIDEHLDRSAPEAIIYGINKRTITDADSQFGFCYPPTYLGRQDLDGDAWHVWMVCGHACADVPRIRVNDVDVIADEGVQWLVPHHAGWAAEFTTPYVDYVSSTYGDARRYTLIYGKVTDLTVKDDELTDPDACALGKKQLTVEVWGVEPNGDGSGDVITKRFQQYKHFAINYLANRGAASYQSGAWLSNPTWTVFDTAVDIVDEDSFDACDAIGDARLPDSGDPDVEVGYIGAAVIGANATYRDTARRWIADWNRSCGCQFCITHLGRIKVFMISPTTEIRTAAPLYRDANEMLFGTFGTTVAWSQQANRVPFKADMNFVTGVWFTNGSATNDASVSNYGREIVSEDRDYPFAPGITATYHLAHIETLFAANPPRYVAFEASVGPDKNGDSLAYLDIGDYFRYRSFAAVSNSMGEIRLAIVMRHQVQVGARRVMVEALDVEDLLLFDAPPGETGDAPGAGESGPVEIEMPIDAVTIDPGDDIQAAIDANPEGTTFWLTTGTHDITDSDIGDNGLSPKTGDLFVGQLGAILDGTSWTTTNEDAAAFYALNDDIDDVTIQNLVIQNMPKSGVSAYKDFSSGWTVDHCEVAYCKRTGVAMCPGFTLTNSYVHHNISDSPDDSNPALRGGGYTGNQCDGAIVENNEISYNGSEQKIAVNSVGVSFKNNFVHHNYKDGVWFDGDSVSNAVVEGNVIEDNGRTGVTFEVSTNATIRNNSIRRNAEEGILISLSEDIDIYGNLLADNETAIGYFLDCSRLGSGQAGNAEYDLANVSSHNNAITVGTGTTACAVTNLGSCTPTETAPYYDGSKNLTFEDNDYVVADVSAAYWYWGTSHKTFDQWRLIPQDAGGTITT
jgi:parallel beta-helix repeat protein